VPPATPIRALVANLGTSQSRRDRAIRGERATGEGRPGAADWDLRGRGPG